MELNRKTYWTITLIILWATLTGIILFPFALVMSVIALISPRIFHRLISEITIQTRKRMVTVMLGGSTRKPRPAYTAPGYMGGPKRDA